MIKKSKEFVTEVQVYQQDRYTFPMLVVVLPEEMQVDFCWGDKVKVIVEPVKKDV